MDIRAIFSESANNTTTLTFNISEIKPENKNTLYELHATHDHTSLTRLLDYGCELFRYIKNAPIKIIEKQTQTENLATIRILQKQLQEEQQRNEEGMRLRHKNHQDKIVALEERLTETQRAHKNDVNSILTQHRDNARQLEECARRDEKKRQEDLVELLQKRVKDLENNQSIIQSQKQHICELQSTQSKQINSIFNQLVPTTNQDKGDIGEKWVLNTIKNSERFVNDGLRIIDTSQHGGKGDIEVLDTHDTGIILEVKNKNTIKTDPDVTTFEQHCRDYFSEKTHRHAIFISLRQRNITGIGSFKITCQKGLTYSAIDLER